MLNLQLFGTNLEKKTGSHAKTNTRRRRRFTPRSVGWPQNTTWSCVLVLPVAVACPFFGLLAYRLAGLRALLQRPAVLLFGAGAGPLGILAHAKPND